MLFTFDKNMEGAGALERFIRMVDSKAEAPEKQYFVSFLNYPEFYGKRFDRYVNKTKQAWLDLCIKDIWRPLFELRNFGLSKDITYKLDSVENFIRGIFTSLYGFPGVTPVDGFLFTPMRETFVHKTFGYDFKLCCDDERAQKVLDFISGKTKHINGVTFDDIMKWEIEEECVDHIRGSILTAKEFQVNETSYMQTVPTTQAECIPMVIHVLNAVLANLDFLFSDKALETAENQSEIVTNLQSENSQLSSEVTELRKQVLSLQTENKRLSEIADGTKESLEIEALRDDINVLRGQNVKLKKKYDGIYSKYIRLKDMVPENVGVEDVEPPTRELDMNGRYLFVADENTTFQQNVLEAFPNSRFCSNNDSLPSPESNIDMVIVISSHIDHSTYGNYKKRCKSLGIPFVHCEYSNVALIKEVMNSQLS